MNTKSGYMEHHDSWDKFIAITCGIIGGILRFLQMDLLDVPYWESLLKASLTALVCGFMGLVGKWVFTSLLKTKWEKFISRFSGKKKQRKE